MDFIVLQLCCTDCKRFEHLYVINMDNLIELRHYIKESFNLDYCYLIYDIDGTFIEYFN